MTYTHTHYYNGGTCLFFLYNLSSHPHTRFKSKGGLETGIPATKFFTNDSVVLHWTIILKVSLRYFGSDYGRVPYVNRITVEDVAPT